MNSRHHVPLRCPISNSDVCEVESTYRTIKALLLKLGYAVTTIKDELIVVNTKFSGEHTSCLSTLCNHLNMEYCTFHIAVSNQRGWITLKKYFHLMTYDEYSRGARQAFPANFRQHNKRQSDTQDLCRTNLYMPWSVMSVLSSHRTALLVLRIFLLFSFSWIFIIFILCCKLLVSYMNFSPKIVQLEYVLNRIAAVPSEECRCMTDTNAFVSPWYLMSPGYSIVQIS